MTTRLLVAETRRYAAAAEGPVWTLLALSVGAGGAILLAGGAPALVLEVVKGAWSVAVLAVLAWLTARLVRAARGPAGDAAAAGHVQSLRDRAIIEGHILVEIHRTLWASQAGQRALTVNVTTGEVSEIWLPEVRVLDGSFVLLTTGEKRATIVGWAPGGQVVAARRHQLRLALRDSSPRGHERQVAHAAEAYLMAEANRTVRTDHQQLHDPQSPEDPPRRRR